MIFVAVFGISQLTQRYFNPGTGCTDGNAKSLPRPFQSDRQMSKMSLVFHRKLEILGWIFSFRYIHVKFVVMALGIFYIMDREQRRRIAKPIEPGTPRRAWINTSDILEDWFKKTVGFLFAIGIATIFFVSISLNVLRFLQYSSCVISIRNISGP